MNDPAVLFYTSDFLTGVIDMTMEERGQYITLICYQHQKGHISLETIRLLVGNVSVKVLNHFKIDENGLYYNARMDKEKEARRKFTESRRENGKKGGRPKKTSAKPNGKPSGKAKNNHMGNENENENINDNIYNFIEENLDIILYPADYEIIQTWEDNELTRYAIKQACLNRAFSVKYVDRIISSYKAKNIKTLTDAKRAEEEYEASKKNKTMPPSWFNKDFKEERKELSEENRRIIESIKNGN